MNLLYGIILNRAHLDLLVQLVSVVYKGIPVLKAFQGPKVKKVLGDSPAQLDRRETAYVTIKLLWLVLLRRGNIIGL